MYSYGTALAHNVMLAMLAMWDLCGTAVVHVFAMWEIHNTALEQHLKTTIIESTVVDLDRDLSAVRKIEIGSGVCSRGASVSTTRSRAFCGTHKTGTRRCTKQVYLS